MDRLVENRVRRKSPLKVPMSSESVVVHMGISWVAYHFCLVSIFPDAGRGVDDL